MLLYSFINVSQWNFEVVIATKVIFKVIKDDQECLLDTPAQ